MVFTMRAATKAPFDVLVLAKRWLWVLVGLLACVLPAGAVVQVAEQRVLRSDDNLYVYARLSLRLSDPVEDALLKGVPVFFVWQADVVRDRWYWRDKRLATSYRTWRLAYQPLTRRWRLSLSQQAPGSAQQQFALHQNVASLEQALAVIGRLHRWPVVAAEAAPMAEEHRVELSFRLDPSLLPRPFQIGVGSSADWDIRWQQRLPVPGWVAPDALEEPVAPDVDSVPESGGS